MRGAFVAALVLVAAGSRADDRQAGGLGLVRPPASDAPARAPATAPADQTSRDPADALHVLKTWEGVHTWAPVAVGVVPEGDRLISSSKDRTAVWYAEGGRPPTVWKTSEGRAGIFIAFQPGAKTALFSEGDLYRERDLESGEALRSWKALKFVRNTQTGRVELEEVESKATDVKVIAAREKKSLEEQLREGRAALKRLKAARNKEDLAVELRKAWKDLPPELLVRAFTGGAHLPAEQRGDHSVRCQTLSADRARALSGGGGDNSVRLWRVQDGALLGTWKGHAGPVLAVALSPDGRTAFSGSWDKTVKVWDVATGKARATLAGHRLAVQALAVTPDGRVLVSGGADDELRLWDVPSGKLLLAWRGHHPGVSAVDLTRDGRRLASTGGDARVRLWDLRAILASVGHPATR